MVVDYVVCRRKKLPEIDKYNREIIMIPPYQVEEGDIIYVDGIQSEFIVEFIMTTEHGTQEAKFAEAASVSTTGRKSSTRRASFPSCRPKCITKSVQVKTDCIYSPNSCPPCANHKQNCRKKALPHLKTAKRGCQ